MENSSLNACDIIVIGAGIAGHCAAIEAASLNATTLLLEKEAEYGGSTAMCGGAFAFAGTRVQREKGIPDSLELLRRDLIACGGGMADERLIDAYVEHQHSAYLWLESLGLRFDNVTLNGGQSVPRLHSLDPVAMLRVLHEKFLEIGGLYRNRTSVRRLICEGNDRARKVVGVELSDGHVTKARKGVVIATGGFSRAPDLIARFLPHLINAKQMGGYGNTGDGLRMAWALGADVADLGFTKGSFGVPVETPLPGKEETAPLIVHAMYKGAVVVNRNGKRFVSESNSYKEIGERCLEQPQATGFQIFDQKVMDQSTEFPTVDNYAAALEAGLLKRADTLEHLAELLGIPADTLIQTIDRYNAARNGASDDEFGRTHLTESAGEPPKVDRSPFYGIGCTTGMNTTYSGIRTNEFAQVLDVFGDPIPNLYATGEVVGGLHGASYLSGSSLAKGCIFGRLASQHALS